MLCCVTTPPDQVEVAPGRVTRYTLLVYLSGRDPSSGSSGIGGTSSSSAAIAPDASTSSGGSGQRTSKRVAGKQQQQQQQHQQQQALAAPCTSAVQPLKGGETVFYGEANGLWWLLAHASSYAAWHPQLYDVMCSQRPLPLLNCTALMHRQGGKCLGFWSIVPAAGPPFLPLVKLHRRPKSRPGVCRTAARISAVAPTWRG